MTTTYRIEKKTPTNDWYTVGEGVSNEAAQFLFADLVDKHPNSQLSNDGLSCSFTKIYGDLIEYRAVEEASEK